MTDMREAVARALAKHDRIEICSDASYALSSYGPKADAALSLMQPEIDRRVAEERAKLLERLREPSEEMLSCVAEAFYEASNMTRWESKGRAAQAFEFALAQFEKENNHEQG